MNTMLHIPVWQYIAVTAFAWLTGLLAGAALFYPVGRRHGITAMADYWKGTKVDDEVAKIARRAGAKVRGDTETKNATTRGDAT